MPALEQIFLATNNASAADSENVAPADAGSAKGEAFDDVMSRALLPHETKTPAAKNRRPENFPDAQKRNSTEAKTSPAAVQDAKKSNDADADSSVTVKSKVGGQNITDADKDADLPTQNGDDNAMNTAQTSPILMLAPTLAACLLKSFVPAAAPKPEAKNQAVAALLPAGAAGKNGAAMKMTPGVDATAKQSVADAISQLEASLPPKTAAQKTFGADVTPAKITDAKSDDISATAIKISGLAGIGDSAPKKVEAVLARDFAHADDAGNSALQNLAAESAAVAPAKSHGTSAAKQDVPMKNAEQTNKVAGLAGSGEKVLPGDAGAVARPNILPVRGNFAPAPMRVAVLEANAATPTAATDTVRSSGTADETATVADVSNQHIQALDRTQELMTLHASRLVEAKADSLQVVIKPDAGTQLSLELRQRGGGIEAQAVLQKGDFENLQQHWPELQQQLEQRGIKLAPLTSTENQTAWSGNQGFKQPADQAAEPEPLADEAFAGFVPSAALTSLLAEPSAQPPARGWQSWA